jgi:hypothetical protein
VYLRIFGLLDFKTALPIAVVARREAWTVFTRAIIGVVLSNPTRHRDSICLNVVRGLATAVPYAGCPTVCVHDQEIEKAANVQQITVKL